MPTNKAYISKVSGILFLLFTISVLISQSLMDLFSTLLCLYLGYQWARSKKQGDTILVVQKSGFEWLWFTWFSVVAIAFFINSPAPGTSAHFWVERLIEFKWILILYFLTGSLRLHESPRKALLIFSAALIACSVYGLIDYYIALNYGTDPSLRLGGIFNFSMTHAHVYGIFFCFVSGYLLVNLRSMTLIAKVLLTAASIASGLSVLFTYTRGAWFAAFLALVIIGFIWNIRFGILSLFCGAALAGLLYLTVPSIKSRIDFTARMADPVASQQSYDNERLVLWKTNFLIFQDHPIFGAGYGQNRYLLREYYDRQNIPEGQFISHAHNQYIHLLAGTGILGLLCYVSVLLGIIYFTVTAYFGFAPSDSHYRGLALGALAAQVFFIAGGLTESNFEHSKVRFAIMIMWALAFWLRKRSSV